MSTTSHSWTQNQWISSDEDTKFFDDVEEDVSKPLREKNGGKKGVHVPHRDKPPQVVAKRNARERRRVQAVNGAFVRLKKAVPYENNRGKRISKVKTLQNAIEYIQNLEELLRKDGGYEGYEPLNIIRNYYTFPQNEFIAELDFELGFRKSSFVD